jgi:hypothetical protein
MRSSRASSVRELRGDAPTSALAARVEADSWAEMQLTLPNDFAQRIGVHVRRVEGGLSLMATKVDNLALNRVLGLGFEQPFTQTLLERLIADYRAAGAARMLVQWSQAAAPPEVPSWLAAAGFRSIPRIAKLWRAAEDVPAPQSDLQLHRIGRDEAETFAQVAGQVERPDLAPGFCSTVGREGWSHYLASDGTRPISAGALRVDREVGWLGLGATLSCSRRRGGHSALLARRVRDAGAAGCKWVVCETTEETPARPNPSYRNMLRLGFEILYLTENFVLDLNETVKPSGR